MQQLSGPVGKSVLDFGEAGIDGCLPGGGLGAGLHEICPQRADLPHEAASTQLTAFLLARGRGPVLWALSRRFLFAPGLAETGLCADRVVYAEAASEEDVLAVAEETLRHGGLGGVVAETHRLSLKASRRLQLAAESTGTVCLALRRWKQGRAPLTGTAAVTRWVVTARPSSAGNSLPRPSWHLHLERCRGGQPRSWNVELEEGDDAHTPLRLRLAAELAGPEAGTAAGQNAA